VVAEVVEIEISDEQLAAQAAREDSNGPSFTALLDRHRRRIWRICYRLMGNEEDANDAAQEVFVALFLQRTRFEGRSRYATWMQSIAVQTCLTLRRSRGRRQRREAAAAEWEARDSQSRDHATQTNVSLDLMQMLDTLEEEDRALVIMKYAEDYSYEELAGIFGRTESFCKMRISRARETLKANFPQETA
jgi:RNA polymerase sigma-70 factor (ECF subfamily)